MGIDITLRRAAPTFVLLGIATAAPAGGGEEWLQGGSYEVTYRLELPHVEMWAVDKTTRLCLRQTEGADGAPIPVLSGNNPLAHCPASNIRRSGDVLRFDIVCEGRGAARAHAKYALAPGAFKGRIAMVMGAKNMTMTEVQIGRRLGRCDLAQTQPAHAVTD